jgi:hypothetical protein
MRLLIALMAVALLAGCVDESPAIDPETNDADGDGFTDAVETRAGTDPTNATSLPVPARVSESISFSGSGMIIGGVDDLGTGDGCGGPVESGTLSMVWKIESPTNVTNVQVSGLIFTATYPSTMPEGDIFVFSPTGEQLTAATPMTVPPASTDMVTVEGNHPAGDYTIEIRGCAGAGEVSLVASGTLAYTPGEFAAIEAQPAEA